MKKVKAVFAGLVAGALLFCGASTASAASEPGAYGACVSEKTGSVRVLEKTNLSKSLYGSCKSTESKVSLASKVTLPVQKTLKEQWTADQAAPLPAKPTATDRAYKSWLDSALPTRVLYTVDGKDYLCTVGRDRFVQVTVGTRIRYVRVPNYSCALYVTPTPTPTAAR
jgi:hypothetical protein